LVWAAYVAPDDKGDTRPVVGTTTQLCNRILLEQLAETRRCYLKFAPSFGPLYWQQTGQQLHLMPLDRYVTDGSWKIAHGVLYTAERLCSFGIDDCPLAQSVLAQVQSCLFLSLFLLLLFWWHVMSCLGSMKMNVVLSRLCFFYVLI
jgi:hypothetical protein